MRPLVCAVVFLVACSKPSGLELEVEPFDGVTSARVFLGTTQVQNISDLTVPYDQSGAVDMTSTDQVFVRAFDNDGDFKSFEGRHSLNFEFTTSVDFQLGAILVVGYDSSGTPIATDLLTNITAPGESLQLLDPGLLTGIVPGQGP